jgi:segregation and condensation protein B
MTTINSDTTENIDAQQVVQPDSDVGTTDAETKSALEALLFVSDEPVSSAQLAKVLSRDLIEVDEALRQLAESYVEENRGFQLR